MRERSFLRTTKRNLASSFRQPNWAKNLMGGDVYFPLFSLLPTYSSLMSFLFSYLSSILSMSHLSINPSISHTHKKSQDSSFFPSLSFEKLMLGKLKPHQNSLTKPGASKSDTQSELPTSTAVSSWVCQSSITSSGWKPTLGYHLGFKFNITETIKLIFLSHLCLLWRRYKQEKEEKKENFYIK